jgi:8-oxo-dGTP pyrophosphatase MutT (NUDIX family)
VRIVRKEVQFAPEQQPEIYHCVALHDYVAVLAKTPDGLIPIVQQYRPAVDAYTWELPAGLLEPGEDPQSACQRELLEETGLHSQSVMHLATGYADTGRLENMQHVYYIEASAPDPHFRAEAGMQVRFVSLVTLMTMIARNKFRQHLHVAAVLLYQMHQTEYPVDGVT